MALGILPPLSGLVWYLLEQVQTHIIGATESSSMVKAAIGVTVRGILIFLSSLLIKDEYKIAYILLAAAAAFTANELLYKIPFMTSTLKNSAEVQSSIDYHFKSGSLHAQGRNVIPFVLTSLLYIIITVAITAISAYAEVEDWEDYGWFLAPVAIVLSLLVWATGIFYRRVTLFCIPLCLSKFRLAAHTYVFRALQIGLLIFAISIYSIPNDLKDVSRNLWYQFYTSIFIFRAYTRALTHTQSSSLEVCVAILITNILDSSFLMNSMNFTQRLCFIAFVIHRLKVFTRKLVYQFTTVWATVENKKQRFKV